MHPKQDPTQLQQETHAERKRLVSMLEDLPAASWEEQSLCDGWRVREAVAHLTMPFRTTPLAIMAGVIGAGFSFNRYADRDARSTAQRLSEADLVSILRANISHPWQPPGGGPAGALSHDVIHGLDVTEPLGLPAPPAERIRLVITSTRARQIAYFGVDLDGASLVATDTEVSVGTGPRVVRATAKEILLAITRRRSLDDLPWATS